jgi:hypothetical protein
MMNPAGTEFFFWAAENIEYDGHRYPSAVTINSRHASAGGFGVPVTILEHELLADGSIVGRAKVTYKGVQSGEIRMTRIGDAPDLDRL